MLNSLTVKRLCPPQEPALFYLSWLLHEKYKLHWTIPYYHPDVFFPQILGARFRLFYYVCDAGKLGHQIDPLYPKVLIIDIFSHCDRSRCRISLLSVRFFSVMLLLTPRNIRIKLRVRENNPG